MKEMLICSDLYEGSDNNLKSGYSFASSLGLKPKIYHIDTMTPQLNKQFHPLTVKPRYIKDPIWNKDIEATVLDMANKALARVGIEKEKVDFENFEGTINEGIEHLTEHVDLEMMAIGITHHGVFHRFFLNTFAEKSLFHVKKDVLVSKKAVENYSHLTYLIPYTPLDEDDLAKVIHIAKCNEAKVHMDCVVPINFVGYSLELFSNEPYPREILTSELSDMRSKAEKELQKAHKIMKDANIECSYSLEMVLNEDAAKRVEEIVQKENSDLVIIKPQHYTFEHLSIGSVSLDIMKNVSSNLLLLKVE